MEIYKEYFWGTSEILPYHKDRAKKIIKLLDSKAQPILDVGCGQGAIANYLIEEGYDVYGIDASKSGIEQANKVNNGRFFVCNIYSKELPEQIKHIPFKTIISMEVIEHLYDPRGYLSFVKNILYQNSGKYLIISTPYYGYWKNLLISIFNRWDIHHNPLWDGGHVKFWSRETLNTILNEQGFKIEKFMGCGRTPYLWVTMMVKAVIKK